VVHYIDYNTDRIRSGNVLVPFMHKRKSYEHEKEIRGVISIFPDLTPDGCKRPCRVCSVGSYQLKVPVNSLKESRDFGLHPEGNRSFKVFACDHCGHVQLFTFSGGSKPPAWDGNLH